MRGNQQHTRPRIGTAAGVAYVALPPTAVDAAPDGPSQLIVAWHGFEPPCTEAAFAAAMPMTGVPAWRVYLGLQPPGGGPANVRDRVYLDLFGPAVEHAADRLPDVLAEVRRELRVADGPIGLTGFSVGGTAALLTLARGAVPVSAAALIAPIMAPARAVEALERRTGSPYQWTDRTQAVAERLDFTAQPDRIAGGIARRDPALLLVCGTKDDLVTPTDMAALRDRLVDRGATTVEATTVKMGHALATEPGTNAEPPIAEAVSVDSALTDWFRKHLAGTPRRAEPPRLRAATWNAPPRSPASI
jgi:dienelactone hydrolase